MQRPSLRPLLLLSLLLAACSGSDESARMRSESIELPEADGPTLNRTREGVTASAPMEPPAASRPGSAQPDFATTTDTAGVALPPPGTVPGEAAVSLNPMLIRTGTATLRVDSLEAGIARVRALAQRVGGIVGNTTISAGTEESRQATIELRIPSAAFDRTVGGLSPIGRVEAVNVTAEDVGEEYTDITARATNARRLESRLLELLDTRSGRLEEVLNVEREVARVREEIERMEGRLRYLRTRASVSVLTLTLHEGRAVIGDRPGEHPIRDAFGEAWRSFIAMIAGLIASLGVLIPLGFLAYVGWRAFRWMRRRDAERDAAYREALRRERERTPTPPSEEPVGRP